MSQEFEPRFGEQAERPSLAREILAALVAALAGTWVSAILAALVLPVSALSLMTRVDLYIVAVVATLTLIWLFRKLGPIGGWAAGLVVLTLLPSLLTKLIFGAASGWLLVLVLNAIFAVTALVVYRFVAFGRL